jgi:hypothetical protein
MDLPLDPGYYPAFTWWEGAYGPQVFGALVIEDGHCFLELSTDGGTLELLHERVATLRDLRFDSVFPV